MSLRVMQGPDALRFGVEFPIPDLSVRYATDFVDTWTAAFLGIQLQFEVAMLDLPDAVQPSFLLDPRLPATACLGDEESQTAEECLGGSNQSAEDGSVVCEATIVQTAREAPSGTALVSPVHITQQARKVPTCTARHVQKHALAMQVHFDGKAQGASSGWNCRASRFGAWVRSFNRLPGPPAPGALCKGSDNTGISPAHHTGPPSFQMSCPGIHKSAEHDVMPVIVQQDPVDVKYIGQGGFTPAHNKLPLLQPHTLFAEDIRSCTILLGPELDSASQQHDGLWLPPNLQFADLISLARTGAIYGHYAMFDTVDHYRARAFHPTWGLVDAIRDAIRNTRAGPIGRIRILRIPFPAIPKLQIVLEPVGIAPDWTVLPIDARAAANVFCTLLVPKAATCFAHMYQATQACPALPLATHRFVARGHWAVFRTAGGRAHPFDANVLDDDAALVLDTRCAGGHSSSDSQSLPSQEDSSLSSTTASSATSALGGHTPFAIRRRQDEHEDEIVIAFHALGSRPWQGVFPRCITPAQIARQAAQRMHSDTGLRHWKIAFMPWQPIVPGIDLHILVLQHAVGGKHFLLDVRRIFGPQLSNLRLLLATPTQGDPQGFACASEAFLDEAGLAEPSWSWHVTTDRPAALVVPALSGLTAAIEDSLQVAMLFPGLRQAILQLSAEDQMVGGTTSTSTTTTAVPANEPFSFAIATPRRTIAFLGIPNGEESGNVVEVTLAWEAELHTILHRLTQQAIAQRLLPEGHSIAVARTQPEAKAARRELLFYLVPPQTDRDTCYVWADLRPASPLTFRRVRTFAGPNCLLFRGSNVRALYINGHRWDSPSQLQTGDLISASIVPQAPDVRPPDVVAGLVSGLQAAFVPLPLPIDANRDARLAQDQEISSAFHWESTVNARMHSLGFIRGRAFFVVIGPGISYTASVGRTRPTLQEVADWAEEWVRGGMPAFRLYDAGIMHNTRWVFVAVPLDLNPSTHYVRIWNERIDLAAYAVPHGILAATMACLIPCDGTMHGGPVPGVASPPFGPLVRMWTMPLSMLAV